jgi:guanosine-3',5'-bis(diphosphate) 3'-pyrophosphohydrolase
MTKRSGESYDDYLERVKENQIARTVKVEDIKHNMDLGRIGYVTSADITRIERYKSALAFLM